MAIDRNLLYRAEQAIKTNSPLDDEARGYAVTVLRTVNHLAYHGFDVDRIYDLEMRKKAGDRIQKSIIELRILELAHKSGRGMNEAKKLLQSKRQGKNVISAEVAYIQVLEGITQTAAQKKLAVLSGREYDDIKNMCAREKNALGGDTANQLSPI